MFANQPMGGDMKFGYVLAAVAAFAVSAPVGARDHDKDKEQQVKAKPAPKEKKICRTETVTGSLIAKRRVCRTQAQWDELAANTKRGIDEYTRLNAIGAPKCINPLDITCNPNAGPH